MNIKSAGILFYDRRRDNVLIGWNHLRGWEGFGGKAEPTDPTLKYTAAREVIEELLEPVDFPVEIALYLSTLLKHKLFTYQNYTAFYLELNQLILVLQMCVASGVKSRLYAEIPRTIGDLIRKRKVTDKAEIGALKLIKSGHSGRISRNLTYDLIALEKFLRK